MTSQPPSQPPSAAGESPGAHPSSVPSARQKGHTEELPLSNRPTMAADSLRLLAEQDERTSAATQLAGGRRTTDAGHHLPALRRPDRDLHGVTLAGRYRLHHRLGRGGMGEVYRARHLTLDSFVAVKIMLADIAMVPGYEKRFHREARAMALLNHPNIVRVMDYGFHDGLPFIVMELIDGMSMSAWLHGLGALPPLAALDPLMRQLFDAFEAAHVAGIVHRDLKPDNLLMSPPSDGHRALKVLDFGLARIDNPDARTTAVTTMHSVSGTPEYMSPEQCRSLRVGPAADLYAMGCVLTELLQGCPPFDGPSHADIMTQQMFVAPPPLQRPAGAEPIPPLLERLRLDLLAKSPARRPQGVAEVRARWQEALDPRRAAQRLPARKAELPLGGRGQRQQQWTQPAARRAPVVEGGARVGLLRLVDDEAGVDDRCALGLATAGLSLTRIAANTPPGEVDVVVVDAGCSIDLACAWLAQVWPQVKAQRLARPVACVQHVDAAVLNRLIAAGAGDVVVYPVEVSVLSRKLRRVLRKSRRSR